MLFRSAIVEISKTFQEVESPKSSKETTLVREMLKLGDAARFAAVNARLQEVAAVVVFACSPEASAINGAALRADGGVVKAAL